MRMAVRQSAHVISIQAIGSTTPKNLVKPGPLPQFRDAEIEHIQRFGDDPHDFADEALDGAGRVWRPLFQFIRRAGRKFGKSLNVIYGHTVICLSLKISIPIARLCRRRDVVNRQALDRGLAGAPNSPSAPLWTSLR